ncbi:ribonuclease HII [Myxococcota bacterium]|nr:ribonuclease HII [Myxococcota bacterium]
MRDLKKDPRSGVQNFLKKVQREKEKEAALLLRHDELLENERELWAKNIVHIAGVDEAGAGPWAGPVVAGAVILPHDVHLPGVDDSKKLTAKKREAHAEAIRAVAIAWGIGWCSPEEIDEINIREASRLAMSRAVEALLPVPDYLLVDARIVPGVYMPQRSMIRGDARSLSIAAASILAKVERDGRMADYAKTYPGYGFEIHAGYGTAAHMEALNELGPCPIHRRSFGPVTKLL